jgi:6-phosphogluconolactonase
MSTEIFRYPTAREAAVACGHRIFALLNEARGARGVATLAVSGGSTPRLMFESMAGRDFDWNRVQLFWVDERMVPPEDEQSNYRMTHESLLRRIQIPAANVHRIAGESVPEEAAAAYAAEIRRVFGLRGDELPVFDVVQRGMGPDMHTASLFPGEPLIENRTDIAAAVWVEKMKQHRVTLLRGVLERARQTLCLVSGTDKAAALRGVLREPPDPMRRPSQIESASMSWYVDDAAYGADPGNPIS